LPGFIIHSLSDVHAILVFNQTTRLTQPGQWHASEISKMSTSYQQKLGSEEA